MSSQARSTANRSNIDGRRASDPGTPRATVRVGPLHGLRHTCVSLLLALGVHPRVVMEILGHSQIAVTADLYTYVLPALNEDAARRMQEALRPDEV